MARALVNDPAFVRRVAGGRRLDPQRLRPPQLLHRAHVFGGHEVLQALRRPAAGRSPKNWRNSPDMRRGTIERQPLGPRDGRRKRHRTLLCRAARGARIQRPHGGARAGAARTCGRGDPRADHPRVEVRTLAIDLARREASQELFERTRAEGIDVDVLVNNAGMFSFCDILRTPDERIERIVLLHDLTATLNCRRFAADMVRRGVRESHILNMSSYSLWMPFPGLALYSASKAFLRSFSVAFAKEVCEHGIRCVTAVCPAGGDEPLWAHAPLAADSACASGCSSRPTAAARGAVTCRPCGAGAARAYPTGGTGSGSRCARCCRSSCCVPCAAAPCGFRSRRRAVAVEAGAERAVFGRVFFRMK